MAATGVERIETILAARIERREIRSPPVHECKNPDVAKAR
jgi:hypothetical protein